MRLNKILFLIFLIVYFIAGLSLLITGSVAHRQASQYSEITGHSLVSGAGFIIALGVIILVLSVLGLFGAYTNRLNLLKIFVGSLAVILLLEFIAVIVAFTLRHKGDSQLRTNLFDSMPQYNQGNSDIVTEWDRLQRRWSCCGVDKWQDWQEKIGEKNIPKSCCLRNDCAAAINETVYFDVGCYSFARNLFFRYSKALGGVSLFFFFVELIGLGLAIHLLRDLKNNYGAV